MNYSITTLGKKTIAGFHLVGPWDHTVKQGFEQLMMWVENHQVPAREWVAVYYDNPEEVPAEKLRCAAAVAVDEDYVIPANSEGVILAAIAGGDYACAARGGGLRLRHSVDAVFRQPAAEHGVSHRPPALF